MTTLNASLLPRRLLEIVIGPILGFLTDPGHPEFRGRLFSTIFLGIIVIPALVVGRRPIRYLIIAATMIFFALGRYNPIVRSVIESYSSLRIARYPEKFSIALIVALSVIAAMFLDRVSLKWRVIWGAITFVPLAACLVRGAPIDWFAPYRVPPMPPLRVCGTQLINYGSRPAREEFRMAARTMPPIFGAVGGLRYAVVAERAFSTPPQIRLHYLRMAGCAVEGALPAAWIVPRVVGVHSVNEEVDLIESGTFDEHTAALAPSPFSALVSPPNARITHYTEGLQDITLSVSTPANALVLVNQSFFRAWSARVDGRELTTLPLNIDRLGIVVPAGDHRISLRFGRHRVAVAIAWIASSITILAGLLALRVEIVNRRASEVERPADENAALR